MKILIIKTVPGEIKTDKITYNLQELGLASALIEKGIQCDIMCCADSKPSIKEITINDKKKLKLYAVKSIKILKNGFLKNIDSIIDKYDLIQVSEYNQLYTWHLAKKYKNKVIIYHGPYYDKFNKRYNLMANIFDVFFLRRYKKLDTFFITKSILASNYLEGKGLKNIHTIGVGIDTNLLSVGDQMTHPFYETIRRSSYDIKLLYIGKIEKRRNTLFLLKILKKLIDDNKNACLIVVGKGEKYKDTFFAKAKELKIDDKILYYESIEQKYLPEIYKMSSVFLLPTNYEIFGMVLLEAMYFGIPTITTLNGGSSMLIKNGYNGFIIKNNNLDCWIDTITKIYNDKKLSKEISLNSVKKIKNEFTWGALANKFVKIYNDKLKNN